MREAFHVLVRLSDHTLSIVVPVAMGACMIEEHVMFSRSVPGPDSAFSLEPDEFKAMVQAIRNAEQALGTVHDGSNTQEQSSRAFQRSLFIVRDMRAGELFTAENLRSIRPGHGSHTGHLQEFLGRRASRDIPAGTPLAWDQLAGEQKSLCLPKKMSS